MKEHIINTFDSLAPIYEHSVDNTSLYNSEYERPSMLNQLPQDLSGKHILDAGCAAGWYTEQLILRGARVTATDVSPNMVAATKRRVGTQAEVLCADLEEPLPFAAQSFDFIVSSLTLHYLLEWTPTFDEFQRILKPSGCLLYSVHHPFMDIKLSKHGDYFTTEQVIDTWKKEGRTFNVPLYRRSLQSILNETMLHFTVEQLIEPQPTNQFKIASAEGYEKLMRNPHFLIIKAFRKEGKKRR
ncbi:class I SAM-dependent methyltransferase [Bacillus solitudinis]|uniref:class I SAM-dependent methyltransferase n=1 Tax=Bacillus solitudinis TaxID=2014074 RepID=UPI000C2416C0|nr:class I SAM-dependent methyltransferase [Bacillus solitudinis]